MLLALVLLQAIPTNDPALTTQTGAFALAFAIVRMIEHLATALWSRRRKNGDAMIDQLSAIHSTLETHSKILERVAEHTAWLRTVNEVRGGFSHKAG